MICKCVLFQDKTLKIAQLFIGRKNQVQMTIIWSFNQLPNITANNG